MRDEVSDLLVKVQGIKRKSRQQEYTVNKKRILHLIPSHIAQIIHGLYYFMNKKTSQRTRSAITPLNRLDSRNAAASRYVH